MTATKAGKTKRGVRRRQHAKRNLSGLSGKGLALPEEELRRLVLKISTRESVGPFVRRMVRLMDSLEAGHTRLVLRLARSSKDPSWLRLMAAVARKVQGGHFVVARNTALCAVGYAYQNSLDCLCDLLSYIDRFKQKHKH
jgi:hypothetical protein